MNRSKRTQQTSISIAVAMLVFIFPPNAFAKSEIKEELHKSFNLHSDGRVTLENVNGNVHIETWDRAEVKVDAVKSGKEQEEMDAVSIDIKSEEDRIQIKTKYPQEHGRGKKRGDSVRVDYHLTVPRNAVLKQISAVNGDLEIEGVGGEITASTVNGKLTAKSLRNAANLSSVNGPIAAEFVELKKSDHVSLETVNGKLSLSLPDKANADIAATSVNGSITSEQDIAEKKHFPVGRELKGRIGDGGAQIKLSSVNGGIKIMRN